MIPQERKDWLGISYIYIALESIKRYFQRALYPPWTFPFPAVFLSHWNDKPPGFLLGASTVFHQFIKETCLRQWYKHTHTHLNMRTWGLSLTNHITVTAWKAKGNLGQQDKESQNLIRCHKGTEKKIEGYPHCYLLSFWIQSSKSKL